jgi:predicted transcriptional regulator
MSTNKVKKDFWDELTQTQKEEIEQGIKDVDEGRWISWEDFKKNI